MSKNVTYDKVNKIYGEGSKNPVHTAIRSIAKELLALLSDKF